MGREAPGLIAPCLETVWRKPPGPGGQVSMNYRAVRAAPFLWLVASMRPKENSGGSRGLIVDVPLSIFSTAASRVGHGKTSMEGVFPEKTGGDP